MGAPEKCSDLQKRNSVTLEDEDTPVRSCLVKPLSPGAEEQSSGGRGALRSLKYRVDRQGVRLRPAQ